MTSRKRQSKKKKGGKKRNKVRPSSRFVLKEKEALLPDTSDPSGKATRLTSFGKGLVASQKEREGEMKGESSPSLRLGGSRFLLLACCSRSVASESACVRACAGVWKGGRRGGEPTLSGEKKLARGQPGGAGAKRRVVSLLVIARPPLPPPLFPPPPLCKSKLHSCARHSETQTTFFCIILLFLYHHLPLFLSFSVVVDTQHPVSVSLFI